MANWLGKLFGASGAREEQEEEESPLEERVRELERWQKDQELVMEEWHGKMRRVLARINRAARVEGEEPELHGAAVGNNGHGDHRQLSVFEAKRIAGGGA